MTNDKRTFILVNDAVRLNAAQCCMEAPDGYVVIIQQATRSLNQSAAMWPYLEGFSKQLQWTVNGEKVWLAKDDYKDILTCAFEGEINPRLAVGWNGGIVMLGRRTREYGKKKFSEFLEFIIAAAALRGVTPIYKNGRKEDGFSD